MRSAGFLRYLATFPVLAFFLFMLVTPTTNQLERGIMLVILALVAFVYALRGHWQMDRAVLFWLLITTLAGGLFVLIGVLHDAPGAIPMSKVYVMWPLVYMFFAGFLRLPGTLMAFHKTIIIGILISAIMGVILVIAIFSDNYNLVAPLLESQGARTGFSEGYVQYRLYNVSTLIYGVGFVFAVLSVSDEKSWCSGTWKKITWSALVLMLIAIVLSGRRSLWLIVFVMPIIISGLLLAARQQANIRLWLYVGVLSIGVIVGLQPLLELDVAQLAQQFSRAIDFEAEESAAARAEQFHSLIAGWMEHPLFGNGLGASAAVIRGGEDLPWAYELSYVALLFHTGLIGILIYSAAVVWIFFAGIRTIHRLPESAPLMLPLLAALAGFLVANATNPYLGTFDYLWVLFLPIAAINMYRMGRF